MATEPRGWGWRSTLFYVGSLVLIALIATKQLAVLLPDGLAGRIGHNSEALWVGVLVAALLQGVYRRRDGSSAPWALVWAISGASLAIAALLLTLGLPSTVATWNESFFAFAVLVPYLRLERPLRFAVAFSVVLLVAIVVLFNTEPVLRLAETLVLLVLAPVAFDVADPTIVDHRATDRPTRRLVWVLGLAAAFVALSILAPGAREDLTGPVALGIDYAYRGAEGFIALIILHLYFSYWLGRRWREGAVEQTLVHREPSPQE